MVAAIVSLRNNDTERSLIILNFQVLIFNSIMFPAFWYNFNTIFTIHLVADTIRVLLLAHLFI